MKGFKINAEIGLCTKEMAHDNPIKDFEILAEEYKDKWSKQMYDYFKECVNVLKKNEKALEIIKDRLIIEDKSDYIQIVCEFSIPSKSKNYDLLKEVLL